MYVATGSSPVLTGVPYRPQDVYVFYKLHLHVGNRLRRGSEHELDGFKFDGEIHLIHYNQKYGSFDNAVTKLDGLVVIGVFLQFQRFYRFLLLGADWKKEAFYDPRQLLPLQKDFLVYQGSLTTPPCSESVRHIVMRYPINISSQNLQALRQLPNNEGSPISQYTNVRPLQGRLYRRVDTNFPCF
ncbi:carbonic anhydrase-like [Gigantopelta aegis]|uniref:carbonic anhydrase-like n=1 Tax=Gigantopelta aegis TaxID=1735272 RepID=UPI001B888D22|nr:carbonic anhydrase-like [Gigantopelta aegis]